jgi:3-dehydroquinate dehydratase/shikimate dehydrogenase
MRAKLCVTVTGRTMADLRARRDQVTNADLVELRLDTVDHPDVAAALAGRRLPVIVTCRPRWEGGNFTGSEEERHRLLKEAQRLGAEYVDIEWRANFVDLLQARGGRGIVLSLHDHTGVPPDLSQRARAMRATHAEVVKLAVTADRLVDTLALLPIAAESATPAVLIAMGDAGLVTRVLASRFRSCWTYAGEAVAPGQVGPERMRDEYNFDRMAATTPLYGVVGRPIMHSLSPAMHNAALRATGIDAAYLPFAARDFRDFLVFADAMAVQGASVTSPFKRDAFDQVSTRDPVSVRTQSANTLRRHEGRWEACNTDVEGFLAPLQSGGAGWVGKRATILGAGGAARAAAEGLQSLGLAVAIAARSPERAAAAADAMQCRVSAWPPPAGSWDVLVNATPVGTAPAVDETPLPGGPFTGELVYDLVYNPPETRLVRDARAAGCRTLGGLEMLVAQAARQFEWWIGQRPPVDVMHQAARRILGAAAAHFPAVPEEHHS